MFRRVLFILLLPAAVQGADPLPSSPDFNDDVRPILADTCFQCHGPDAAARQADLRLDLKEGLFGKSDAGPIVVPGQPDQSVLIQRITSADPEIRMPPADFPKHLQPAQIETLRRWVEAGARWEGHWAFLSPERPDLPTVANERWIRNPIDRFVLAPLEERGWSPAAEASPETLLRRVSLDLTGLPPSAADVAAYLHDPAPDRYERLVDRLLASPAYGEHMAVAWLDAARYADTSGYQNDGPRYMWRWRDWVIDAYNTALPFDQFTIEQLAGDLLPQATMDQRIATGFNRNHRGNSEGGSLPEEFAVEYVADRVDTTATVWLGLTVACARCHDHKYDPITQEEYYQLFAYFNNVPESGRAIKEGNSPPFLIAPTDDQQAELARLDRQVSHAHDRWRKLASECEQSQEEWEASLREDADRTDTDWTIDEGLIARFPLATSLDSSLPDLPAATISSGEPSFSEHGPGGVLLDGERFLQAGDIGNFSYFDSFSIAAWVRPEGDLSGGIVSRMTDDAYADGWSLHLEGGKVQVNLVKRWLDDALRVETVNPLRANEWQHVLMTYDGSRVAAGVRIYVNGRLQEHTVNLDMLNQSMETKEPLRIGSSGSQHRFTGALADVRIYERKLSDREAAIVSVRESILQLAAVSESQRTLQQQAKLNEFFLVQASPVRIREAYQTLRRAEQQRERYYRSLPTTMVMQDRAVPTETFLLARGSYDQPTERVAAGVPEALNVSVHSAGSDRLALARWLVQPDHPLTARVVVNREWQRFFGTGIVKTAEDFGTQGERPSHPRLLDWLAVEFVASGWDLKRLQRQIVTSATYRQDSALESTHAAADPENRLLSRGPRFRMSAEMIRDRALAVSGLLEPRLGGPSVKPYQPAGLWSQIATDMNYPQSTGPDLYRRSLYSYWKRTVANPTLTLFDATTREACTVRRSRTNTPLQALALMNDVTFVEAARVLAERVLVSAPSDVDERVRQLFFTALGRAPDEQELRMLSEAYVRHRQHYEQHPDAAEQLIHTGDAPSACPEQAVELAACTAVASVVINLDEFVTKE